MVKKNEKNKTISKSNIQVIDEIDSIQERRTVGKKR